MRGTKEELLDIESFVISTLTVQCGCCDLIDRSFADSKQKAVDKFYDYGWRVDDGHLLCPECAKRSK